MQNPAFVALNGHRIKVQRWQEESGIISFTTVIRGEHLGNDLVSAVQSPVVTLEADSGTSLVGTARLLDRRCSGAGPTAVHRLEIRFVPDPASNAKIELSIDEKLDAIIAELRSLRREVQSLRLQQSPRTSGGMSGPAAGTTMLDFEIPVDDDQSE